MGSASELEYHLLLSCDLNYLPKDHYLELNKQLAEVKRMLVALARKVAIDRVKV
jgi:four helix bundle protein